MYQPKWVYIKMGHSIWDTQCCSPAVKGRIRLSWLENIGLNISISPRLTLFLLPVLSTKGTVFIFFCVKCGIDMIVRFVVSLDSWMTFWQAAPRQVERRSGVTSPRRGVLALRCFAFNVSSGSTLMVTVRDSRRQGDQPSPLFSRYDSLYTDL